MLRITILSSINKLVVSIVVVVPLTVRLPDKVTSTALIDKPDIVVTVEPSDILVEPMVIDEFASCAFVIPADEDKFDDVKPETAWVCVVVVILF